MIDRLTGVTSRTLATFNESSSEGPIPDDTPVFVCGSPISRQAILHDDQRGSGITQQICHNLGMPKGELDLPMDCGSDFPVNDLIVRNLRAQGSAVNDRNILDTWVLLGRPETVEEAEGR